jgi:synaptosomal-associated protein 29
LIEESTNIGIQTATELDRQREQLERTNQNLDNIDANLDESQKDINGMKSFFYRMINSVSPKSKEKSVVIEQKCTKVEKVPVQASYINQGQSTKQYGNINNTTTKTVSDEFENQLDEDLELISHGLDNLKNLATNLGEEVQSQNELLDHIGTKMEKVDVKIDSQNREVSQLLGKKVPSNSDNIPDVTSGSFMFKAFRFFK